MPSHGVPMSLAISWLLFPLVLGLLSLGCGLLLEFAAGQEIPRTLLLPLGFAAIAVIALCTTASSRTARLTTPVVVTLAAAGLVLAFPWWPRRAGGWAAATATATYAALGAPVFLSGNATFAGYIKLDDTATWLAFSDRLLEHGRNVAGLAPSTYEATLGINLIQNGYPAGAFAPLGIMHELLGTDSAWLFQPYIAFLGAMLALALYGLTVRVIESASFRAFAVFVAAQPALLYGYSLWGGLKEEASAALLVLVAALTPLALRPGVRMRNLLPLAVGVAGLLGVNGFVGAVWIAPILFITLVAGFRLRGLAFARTTGAFVMFATVLSIPTLLLTGRFLNATGATSIASGGPSAGLASQNDLGNLFHPLSDLQAFGIWPIGDFRLRPENIGLTYVLVAIAATGACAGLWMSWRRREWGLLLYVLGAALGGAASVAVGSPWIDAKALAIASPAVLIAALIALAWLFRSGRRVEAAVAILAIAGGVFWSNVLAYHDVWLAPRSQLSELETIGKQFSGDGPALMTEYAPYGVRHFLRHMDPEGASELRRRLIPLHNGQPLEKGAYADIDDFQLSGILVYRTLVLVHSPSASRPPSVYRLVWSGPYYDVWQRPQVQTARILEHVPLGNDSQPAAAPACGEVLRIARVAAASNGRVATVVRSPVTIVDLSAAVLPATWQRYTDTAGAVDPSRPGTLHAAVNLPIAGRYGLWLSGSFHPRLELSVDGHRLAIAGNQLNHPGVDTPLGQTQFASGPHNVSLLYAGANLFPGSAGTPPTLGPLVLSRSTAESSAVTYLRPAQARSLCGKRLDWIEAITGTATPLGLQ
jgi:hypothetical protein